MNGWQVAAAIFGSVLYLGAVGIIVGCSRRPLTRVSERHGERRVLRATPAYARRRDRPLTAIVEPRIYEITTLPAAEGARAARGDR